jgi:hypothetical protein
MTALTMSSGGSASRRLSINPVGRLLAIVSQMCCSHTYLRKAGSARLWLECADCGHTTCGLDVGRRSHGVRPACHAILVCQGQ